VTKFCLLLCTNRYCALCSKGQAKLIVWANLYDVQKQIKKSSFKSVLNCASVSVTECNV
jgi:hypothetical protein